MVSPRSKATSMGSPNSAEYLNVDGFSDAVNKKQKSQKAGCRKYFSSCIGCFKKFRRRSYECLRYTFWVLPNKFGEWVERKTRRLGVWLGFEVGKWNEKFIE